MTKPTQTVADLEWPLQEWDYEKNNELMLFPDQLGKGSSKLAWWKCPVGHSYQQIIHRKVSRHSGCPVCSGHLTVPGINDFATVYPELAKEWHPTSQTRTVHLTRWAVCVS